MVLGVMDTLSANSASQLTTILLGIDLSVSPRGDGRTTEETERWSICRLLATLNKEQKLIFPFQLTKSEKPDFTATNGNTSVGFELTEVVKEDLARALALPESNRGITDHSFFRWNDQKRTLQELRELMGKEKLTGPGWVGFEAEKEFADAIADRIRNKTEKLLTTYSRYDEDWLLIYQNLSLPALHLTLAIGYLVVSLQDYWSYDGFNVVAIESGNYLILLSGNGINTYEINNLWH
jgi:hypothetical protein